MAQEYTMTSGGILMPIPDDSWTITSFQINAGLALSSLFESMWCTRHEKVETSLAFGHRSTDRHGRHCVDIIRRQPTLCV